jgi:hypothetical protein
MVCRFQFYENYKWQKIRVDDVMFSGDTCFHFNGYVNHHKTLSRVQHNPYVAVDACGQTTVRCETYGNTLLGPDLGRRIEPRKISPVAEWCVGNVSGWIVAHNRYRFYFQKDEEPPHSAGVVQKLLDGLGAGDHWIATRSSRPYVFSYGVVWSHLCSMPITRLATWDIITRTSEPVRYSVQRHINFCE